MSTTGEVRNLRFTKIASVPRFWHGGRRSRSTFFDNLSVFLPTGERFFVASVHAFEDQVKDPTLRAAVRLFCGQEGMHSREHVRYNESLAAHGYPVASMEARVKVLLGRAARRLSPRHQLAMTCSLEHFTALMGQRVLEDPRIFEGAHPTIAALWRWHSAEENEHKAVAFDVYEAVGGTYFQRAYVMAYMTLIFWAKVIEQQARMMRVDGTLTSSKEWLDLLQFLFVEPGLLRDLSEHYFDYFRPDFHPDQIESDRVVEAWKRSLSNELALELRPC